MSKDMKTRWDELSQLYGQAQEEADNLLRSATKRKQAIAPFMELMQQMAGKTREILQAYADGVPDMDFDQLIAGQYTTAITNEVQALLTVLQYCEDTAGVEMYGASLAMHVIGNNMKAAYGFWTVTPLRCMS